MVITVAQFDYGNIFDISHGEIIAGIVATNSDRATSRQYCRNNIFYGA
jgi:hypothetical protein